MLRPLALATAALLALTACGSDAAAPTAAAPAAPFSLSVATTTVARTGDLRVTLRNDTGRSVESGTFCVDGGLEQQVGGTWVAVPQTEPRACSLPLLLWSPGLERSETIPMATWASSFSGGGPWTVRATYRVQDGTNTIVLRSAPITVTP